MKKLINKKKILLNGFNNLTKSLSFNLYDFCIARNDPERISYVKYIEKNYNAKIITKILSKIAKIMDAQIIGISDQNYDPWGASSMILLSDIAFDKIYTNLKKNQIDMHLNKSHICAHTYPDFTQDGLVCSFRIDIDISTCGEVSPLKALNYMFESFSSDVVVIDYVVRGFTRDINGKRIYLDHEMTSIQNFIDKTITKDYKCQDISIESENIWQTKMLRSNLIESSYFRDQVDLKNIKNKKYIEIIKKEMKGVFNMTSE